MKLLLATVMIGVSAFASRLAPPQSSDPDANPEGYWNMGWNCGQSAESYSVTIVADDPATAFSKVDAVMVAAGAPSQTASVHHYGRQQNGEGARQAHYTLPLKAGEKAAKKVWEMGELTNYSVSRQNIPEMVRAIDERIDALSTELADEAIDRMPAARYFLKSRQGGLRETRAACLRGADQSIVMVAIHHKPKPLKR